MSRECNVLADYKSCVFLKENCGAIVYGLAVSSGTRFSRYHRQYIYIVYGTAKKSTGTDFEKVPVLTLFFFIIHFHDMKSRRKEGFRTQIC